MSRMTQTQAVTVRLMTEGGTHRIPADSLNGRLYRPQAKGWPGGRMATFETLFDFFIDNVPDPDSALAQDADFDEKLRQQADVHACMRLRELTVASMPAHFQPSSDANINKELAQKVADYCDDVFNGLSNRCDLYRQMQNAVLAGGQGIEFNWNLVQGAWRPTEFNPVHKSRFVFDRLGNMSILTRETPVWGSYVAVNPNRANLVDGHQAWPTPPGKFVYHRYMAEGGPWARPASEGYVYWGRGEDTNLYVPVTFGNFALRFWVKWLERYGIPLNILYHPDNESTNNIMAIANSVRGESVAFIPRMANSEFDGFYKLDHFQPSGVGADSFRSFLDDWVRTRVEKILLGGANLMQLGPNGSYGATVNQEDRGAQIIFRYDATNIDTTINLQMVPAMCQARFPGLPVAYYPKHTMSAEVGKDRLAEIEILKAAAEMVPVREEDVYEAIGYPAPTDDDKTVFLGADGAGTGDTFDGFPDVGGEGTVQGQEQPRTSPMRKVAEMNIARHAAGNPRNPLGATVQAPQPTKTPKWSVSVTE